MPVKKPCILKYVKERQKLICRFFFHLVSKAYGDYYQSKVRNIYIYIYSIDIDNIYIYIYIIDIDIDTVIDIDR